MKRSGFKSRSPERKPARQIDYTPTPRRTVVGSGLLAQAMAMNGPEPVGRAIGALLKTPDRKDQRIRDSARGEECLVRLPGCPSDPAMTIWSHNRHGRAGKGAGIKSLCLNGAYACTHCDAIYDGQLPLPEGWTREAVELAWYGAHAESLVRARQKGLV